MDRVKRTVTATLPDQRSSRPLTLPSSPGVTSPPALCRGPGNHGATGDGALGTRSARPSIIVDVGRPPARPSPGRAWRGHFDTVHGPIDGSPGLTPGDGGDREWSCSDSAPIEPRPTARSQTVRRRPQAMAHCNAPGASRHYRTARTLQRILRSAVTRTSRFPLKFHFCSCYGPRAMHSVWTNWD